MATSVIFSASVSFFSISSFLPEANVFFASTIVFCAKALARASAPVVARDWSVASSVPAADCSTFFILGVE